MVPTNIYSRSRILHRFLTKTILCRIPVIHRTHICHLQPSLPHIFNSTKTIPLNSYNVQDVSALHLTIQHHLINTKIKSRPTPRLPLVWQTKKVRACLWYHPFRPLPQLNQLIKNSTKIPQRYHDSTRSRQHSPKNSNRRYTLRSKSVQIRLREYDGLPKTRGSLQQ